MVKVWVKSPKSDQSLCSHNHLRLLNTIHFWLHWKRPRLYTNQVRRGTKESQKENDNSVKLVKTLCIIFVVFVTCWLPYTLITVSVAGACYRSPDRSMFALQFSLETYTTVDSAFAFVRESDFTVLFSVTERTRNNPREVLDLDSEQKLWYFCYEWDRCETWPRPNRRPERTKKRTQMPLVTCDAANKVQTEVMTADVDRMLLLVCIHFWHYAVVMTSQPMFLLMQTTDQMRKKHASFREDKLLPPFPVAKCLALRQLELGAGQNWNWKLKNREQKETVKNAVPWLFLHQARIFTSLVFCQNRDDVFSFLSSASAWKRHEHNRVK